MTRVLTFLFIGTLLFACGTSKNKKEEAQVEKVLVGTPLWDELEMEVIAEPTEYRATETVHTDLIHTKLEVNFNWDESQMNGKATITAKPHFYPSDSIVLDAKGMDILKVQMAGKDLTYIYAEDFLRIKLGQTYTRADKYTIVIDYIAKPDERTTGGSDAITSDKGLFFINPKNEESNKMPQIWTQGETESSSVWFPTIDAPNVKTSQEIFMTVKDRYITLSNGKMISSKKNSDGTRTDHWKQDLPHAPYLFMMGIGEFVIIKDSYTRPDGSKMDVNYYVEKEWESSAKAIFGATPEMIGHFSKLLKVEYPWDKYHQIVVRDYVSGAMENTGAVIFGDYAYKTERELLDDNDQSTIAHELFHHWFGDLVTAESWSNLTLNESFANYSQYLWDDYKYGRDEADYQAVKEEDGYMQSSQMGGYHELAWFHYSDKEKMFDGHSYNKGGRILHMLRNYLGDDAFFTALSKYLNDNKFKAAEYHQLRLAFEEVCGEDLNWFFKQWYESKGHPILEVSQTKDEVNLTVTVNVVQSQDSERFAVFKLPVDIAIHDSNGKRVHRVWVDELEENFELPYNGTLRAVVFDEEKMLLGKINEDKPQSQYVYQFYNSDRYETRLQSLEGGVESGNASSDQMILDGLNDSFWHIRAKAIQMSAKMASDKQMISEKIIKNLMFSDPKSQVRAAAAAFLSKNAKGNDMAGLLNSVIDKDQSYLVIGTALKQLSNLDPDLALASAKKLENENSSKILSSVAQVYSVSGREDNAEFFRDLLMNRQLGIYDQLASMNAYTLFNARMSEDQISESLKVYRHLNRKGGYYTKMFASQSVEYLVETLNQRKEDLEGQKAAEEDTLVLAEIQARISRINVVMADFSSFFTEK